MTFFPGVVLIKKLDFFTDYTWYAIWIITLHNTLDTFGRYIASWVVIIKKKYYVLACLCRLVFVVTYLLFYFEIAPHIFRNDVFIIVNLCLFAISCGYLGTLGMCYGSDKDVK